MKDFIEAAGVLLATVGVGLLLGVGAALIVVGVAVVVACEARP